VGGKEDVDDKNLEEVRRMTDAR